MTRWTPEDDSRYRQEMERRFRSRTPPIKVDDVLAEARVTRGEMRAWAEKELHKRPPETDRAWMLELARWYRRMAQRVDPTVKFRMPVEPS